MNKSLSPHQWLLSLSLVFTSLGEASLKVVMNEKAGSLEVFREDSAKPIITQNAKEDFRPYLHPIVAPDGSGLHCIAAKGQDPALPPDRRARHGQLPFVPPDYFDQAAAQSQGKPSQVGERQHTAIVHFAEHVDVPRHAIVTGCVFVPIAQVRLSRRDDHLPDQSSERIHSHFLPRHESFDDYDRDDCDVT